MVKKIVLFFVTLNFISCTEKSLDLSQNEEFAIAEKTYFPTQEEKTKDLEAITFIQENLQNKSSESLKKQ
jgi:hypothetical protein